MNNNESATPFLISHSSNQSSHRNLRVSSAEIKSQPVVFSDNTNSSNSAQESHEKSRHKFTGTNL